MRRLKQLQQTRARFFNLTDRFFKTDTRYLTKSGLWLLVGNVVQAIVKFVSLVAFANLLAPDEYGVYRFILSITAVITVFTLSGMGGAITQAVARGHEGAFRSGVRSHFRWSIGIALAAGAVGLYYIVNDNYVLATGILIAGAFSPFFETYKLYDNFLDGKRAFRDQFFVGLPRKLLPVSTIIIALLLTNSPVILIAVYFASNTLATWWACRHVLAHHKPNESTDPQTLNYGKHLSLINVLARVAANLDKILVFHYLGAAPLALYSFAQSPVSQLSTGTNALKIMAMPKLSNRPLSELRRTLPRKLFLLFALLLVVVGLYILAAPFLFRIFLPQYTNSVLFSQILSLGILFTPLAILRQSFYAHMKKKEVYATSIIGHVSNITALVILLPLYGIWGAIGATLFAKAVVGFSSLILFIRIPSK